MTSGSVLPFGIQPASDDFQPASGEALHRDEPLVGEHRLDHHAGAARTRNPQLVGLLGHQQAGLEAALHRRAAASLPPLTPSADVKWLMHARANLSFAIIAARPNARQGDVFTTPVATAFRAVIREALANVDVEAMLWDLYEECEVPSRYRLQVNGGYPGWATHEMPIVLLDALPILPEGIVYRLVDRHLVIWDVDADLIVDVLPDALPGAGS